MLSSLHRESLLDAALVKGLRLVSKGLGFRPRSLELCRSHTMLCRIRSPRKTATLSALPKTLSKTPSKTQPAVVCAVLLVH